MWKILREKYLLWCVRDSHLYYNVVLHSNGAELDCKGVLDRALGDTPATIHTRVQAGLKHLVFQFMDVSMGK